MRFHLLLDLHYSDSWADPGKQPTPAAWSDGDVNRSGHGEAAVVHPLKLVKGRKAMDKHRLAVDRYLMGQDCGGAGICGSRHDRTECRS